MANGVRCFPDVIQFLGIDSFDTVYVPLSPAFSYPSNFMIVANDTNYTVLLSFDGGATSHLALAPNTTIPLDFSSNKNAQGNALYMGQFIPIQARTISIPDSPAGTGIGVTSFYTQSSGN